MAKILIKTLQGSIIVIRDVTYSIEDGFVCFTDPKTSEKKKFATSSCEIVEDDA